MNVRSTRGLAVSFLAVATVATGAAAAEAAPGAGAPASAVTSMTFGKGWTAAIHHPTQIEDDQARLVMVSPTGVVRPIGAVSDDANLYDVSQDGRYVVTGRFQDGQVRVAVWDTATRRPTFFRYAFDPTTSTDNLLQLGGAGVVAMTSKGLQNYTLTGTPVGSPTLPASTYTVSPDGRTVFTTKRRDSADAGITAYDASTGTYTGGWSVPNGYLGADAECRVSQRWTATTWAMDCTRKEADGTIGSQSFRLNADQTVSTLTPARSALALKTTSTQAAWRQHPQPGMVCTQFGRLDGATLKAVPGMPISCTATYEVAGAYGSGAWVLQMPADVSQAGTLKRYDTTTGAVQVLAGVGSATGGLITQARTIDGQH